MKPNLHFHLDLKTIILLSSLLAVALNVWQFFDSALQRRDAFSPAWAYADKAAGPTPLPAAPRAPAAQAPAPAPDPVATATAKLTAAGLKPGYAALYLNVQARTGTPWQLLAAVHSVETGQSDTTSRASYAGAIGPMQFMPATFNHYAADGNGDGVTSIANLDDAMVTAGRYLAAGGADKGRYSNALYNYNHSWSYVSKVTGIAHHLGL